MYDNTYAKLRTQSAIIEEFAEKHPNRSGWHFLKAASSTEDLRFSGLRMSSNSEHWQEVPYLCTKYSSYTCYFKSRKYTLFHTEV